MFPSSGKQLSKQPLSILEPPPPQTACHFYHFPTGKCQVMLGRAFKLHAFLQGCPNGWVLSMKRRVLANIVPSRALGTRSLVRSDGLNELKMGVIQGLFIEAEQ